MWHPMWRKRNHSVEKTYSCDKCPAQFNQKGNLTTHQRIHSGEKPYSGDQCPAKYKQKGILTSHQLEHIDINIFKGTSLCGTKGPPCDCIDPKRALLDDCDCDLFLAQSSSFLQDAAKFLLDYKPVIDYKPV